MRTAIADAGGDEETADTAELICSELSANAVRHAHSAFTVRVVCSSKGVRVAVADEAEPFPHLLVRREPAHFPVRPDRGLGIVDALAAEWGVHDRTRGKVVWATLETAQTPRSEISGECRNE